MPAPAVRKAPAGRPATSVRPGAAATRAAAAPPPAAIEVWLRPAAILDTGRSGIFDNENQYGMFVLPGGTVQCSGGGISVSVAGVVAVDAWTHVACVYDGASWTLHTGGDMTVVPGGAALGQAGAIGSRLGGNAPTGEEFTGTLDELRVWSSVRSAEAICADSGDCSGP